MSSPISNKALAEQVFKVFTFKKQTLCLAESCTGGSISSYLTKIPGSSRYFLGSLVCYSNELKSKLLFVSQQALADYGAVSEQVVKEMATGIMKQTSADVGVAVTGIAGPDGGTPSKPVGTVWAAIVRRGSTPVAWKFLATGDREMVIEKAVNEILTNLLKTIQAAKL